MSSYQSASRRYNLFFKSFIDENLLSEEEASAITERCMEDGIEFCTYLLKRDIVPSADIARILAKDLRLPLFDWDSYDPQLLPRELIDASVVATSNAVPMYIKDGNTLVVAISDPVNSSEVRVAGSYARMPRTETVISDHNKLMEFIGLNFSHYDVEGVSSEDLIKNIISEGGVEVEPQERQKKEEDSPLIQLINKTLLNAIRSKASDLHFEPFEKRYRVRFRVDGVLREALNVESSLAPRLTSRIKVMAGMDISEKRMPQDGRIRIQITEHKAIDFRVNSLPTAHGEKIVLRILDSSSAKMGIDHLGYEPDQKEMYLEALNMPQGMILITGPTGSGKTVSLYTGLNILNDVGVNISTAEDPIEINLDGVNQVGINVKSGLTFASVLRAFLRQDPDVIMVGEIRDLETAEISVKAAQTGHMVLSTLHTNSAAETITRLANMGVPSYNIATSVNLVIAQRLARKLCNHCKVVDENITEYALQSIGFSDEAIKNGLTIYKPVGCEYCDHGYKGRVGIYEVVKITPEISKIIMDGGTTIEINEVAQQLGFNNLRQSGLKKVAQGTTSLKELLRVTTDR